MFQCRHDTFYVKHQINSPSPILFQRSGKWNYGTKCNWCQDGASLLMNGCRVWHLTTKVTSLPDSLVQHHLIKFRYQSLKSICIGFCLWSCLKSARSFSTGSALPLHRLLETWKIFSHIFPLEIHVFVLETTEIHSSVVIFVVLQPFSDILHSDRCSSCTKVSPDRNARKYGGNPALLPGQAIYVAILEQSWVCSCWSNSVYYKRNW